MCASFFFSSSFEGKRTYIPVILVVVFTGFVRQIDFRVVQFFKVKAPCTHLFPTMLGSHKVCVLRGVSGVGVYRRQEMRKNVYYLFLEVCAQSPRSSEVRKENLGVSWLYF